ncbi:MAG TPA: NUDIX domain-containing protein [Burkholderiales bacterium]|nr:NUDIX domain-containing protein [Burkholderiales bacterium]
MPSSRLPPNKILSCGVVVVHFDGERYRLLAMRSFASWDFPKALVTSGEDPLQIALEEVREATGFSDLELNWGEDAFRETLPFEDGSVSRYYLAQSKTAEVTLRVPPGSDSVEDFEYRWVTLEEAEDILPPRLALVLDWVGQQLASGAR